MRLVCGLGVVLAAGPAVAQGRDLVGFERYASGAHHRIAGLRSPELHFVLGGTLRCGDGVYGRWTAFMFEPGDDRVLEAVEATETYVVSLPVF